MTTFRMIMGRIWRPIAASALVLLLTISVHKARQYGFSRLIIVTVLLVLVPIFDALLLNLFFTLKLIRRLKRRYGAKYQSGRRDLMVFAAKKLLGGDVLRALGFVCEQFASAKAALTARGSAAEDARWPLAGNLSLLATMLYDPEFGPEIRLAVNLFTTISPVVVPRLLHRPADEATLYDARHWSRFVSAMALLCSSFLVF